MKISKQFIGTIKAVDENERTITATVSTGTKDRVGESIPASEWKLTNYNKNPVILWAHDYSAPPVGKALWTKIEGDGLIQKIKFAATDFATDIFNLYKDGFLNAFSVGFQADRDVDNPNVFKNCELLEVSAVPVPCNADALAQRMIRGEFKLSTKGETIVKDIIKAMTKDEETETSIHIRVKPPEDFEQDSFRTIPISDSQGIQAVIGKLKGETTTTIQKYIFDKSKGWTMATAKEWVKEHEGKSKGVIGFHDYGIADEATEWDGPAQIRDADVETLRKICAWYDAENPDIKASYKLPHHDAGTLKAVWKGVAASMAVLLGARGGVDIPEADKAGVYNHIKSHYAQFDKETPEMREYTPAQLKALFEINPDEATAREMTLIFQRNELLAELGQLKIGRVLSRKNRELIGTCIDAMANATKALTELYDATDPDAGDDDKAGDKHIDKSKKSIIISDKKQATGISAKDVPEIVAAAIQAADIPGAIRREINRLKGTIE